MKKNSIKEIIDSFEHNTKELYLKKGKDKENQFLAPIKSNKKFIFFKKKILDSSNEKFKFTIETMLQVI